MNVQLRAGGATSSCERTSVRERMPGGFDDGIGSGSATHQSFGAAFSASQADAHIRDDMRTLEPETVGPTAAGAAEAATVAWPTASTMSGLPSIDGRFAVDKDRQLKIGSEKPAAQQAATCLRACMGEPLADRTLVSKGSADMSTDVDALQDSVTKIRQERHLAHAAPVASRLDTSLAIADAGATAGAVIPAVGKSALQQHPVSQVPGSDITGSGITGALSLSQQPSVVDAGEDRLWPVGGHAPALRRHSSENNRDQPSGDRARFIPAEMSESVVAHEEPGPGHIVLSSVAVPTTASSIPLFDQAAVRRAIDAALDRPAHSDPASSLHKSGHLPTQGPVQSLELELAPGNGDAVKIKLALSEGALALSITTEDAALARYLNDERSALTSDLLASGYAVTRIAVEVSKPIDVAAGKEPSPQGKEAFDSRQSDSRPSKDGSASQQRKASQHANADRDVHISSPRSLRRPGDFV